MTSIQEIKVLSRSGIKSPSNSQRGVKGSTGKQGPRGPRGKRGHPGKCCDHSKEPTRIITDGASNPTIFKDDSIVIIESPKSIILTLDDASKTIITETDSYEQIPIVTILIGDGNTNHHIRNGDTMIVLRNNRRYTLYCINGKWTITN